MTFLPGNFKLSTKKIPNCIYFSPVFSLDPGLVSLPLLQALDVPAGRHRLQAALHGTREHVTDPVGSEDGAVRLKGTMLAT